MNLRAAIGCLTGGAVGDSMGLPYEGLRPARAKRLFPGPLRHHLLPGRGMVSDDTEHACFTARALILANGDVDRFGRVLAASLRWWLAGLPAGIGLATLRSLVKSCIGFPPHRTGVFSAGNGPAMRSAIIGVAMGDTPAAMCEFVRRSTRITHTDPKAFHGALAVALAAHCAARAEPVTPAKYLAELQVLLANEGAMEFVAVAQSAARSASAGEGVGEFARAIESRDGISGYMLHTVPCVLQVWFKHPDDFARGLREIVGAGGDTDTAGAIYGGIAGARAGKEGIPREWIEGIVEWPRSIGWIERLAVALVQSRTGGSARCPGYVVAAMPVRNLVFMLIVLAHGFRRLAPPY
jgi:ADP-ribosyl-[dinitrogen reductase] hydrolase